MTLAAPPKKRPQRRLSPLEMPVRVWISEHRGTLSRIAEEFGVSPQFVRMIAYCEEGRKSAGMRIERRLSELGCPLPRKMR